MRLRIRPALLLVALAAPFTGAVAGGAERHAGMTAVEPDAAWRFRVYLDDREIGYHHFFLDGADGQRQMRSVAVFEYRLMFLTLYEYEHENRETWSGDCLQSIESRTDANGTPYAVEGRREDGAFRVEGSAGETRLSGCVMSFAYWNPAFLEQEYLLNAQNGEYLPVEISPPITDSVEVRGERRRAYRYRLEAGELSLRLWYSTDKEWLALESDVGGGRTLRYELI